MSFLFNFDQFYEKRDDVPDVEKPYKPPFGGATEDLLLSISLKKPDITKKILKLKLPVVNTLIEDKEVEPQQGDYIPSETNIHALLHGTLEDARLVEKIMSKQTCKIRFRLTDRRLLGIYLYAFEDPSDYGDGLFETTKILYMIYAGTNTICIKSFRNLTTCFEDGLNAFKIIFTTETFPLHTFKGKIDNIFPLESEDIISLVESNIISLTKRKILPLLENDITLLVGNDIISLVENREMVNYFNRYTRIATVLINIISEYFINPIFKIKYRKGKNMVEFNRLL